MNQLVQVDCEWCKGHGFICENYRTDRWGEQWDETDCPECFGTGTVKIEANPEETLSQMIAELSPGSAESTRSQSLNQAEGELACR